MTLVLNANVLLAGSLPDEPLEQEARRALRHWTISGVGLVAPRFFRDEVVAVVRKSVFQKRVEVQFGRALLDELFHTNITFFDDDELLVRAYEKATQFNLPRTYDAEYLALAERLNCEFWTADKVLVNSVQAKFTNIRWLGNFTP